MSTALAKTETALSTAPVVDAALLTSYLDAMGLAQNLTRTEKEQFLQIAQAFQLNPFKREIYPTKYGNNASTFSIIVGFETYLKRAERTGKLDGWEAEFRGQGDNLSCVVTIYRKDWTRPFKHEAFYIESVQKTRDGHVTSFWKKPMLMTRKVAISQAFRLCFPDELGGMPYTNDELGVEIQETTATVVEAGQAAGPVQEAKPVRPTKRQTAEEMKAHQQGATTQTALADLVYEEDLNPPTGGDFVLDYIDEWSTNIEKSEDDQSWDWNEEQLSIDTRLPEHERVALIKRSIMHRTGKVTSVAEAEVVKKRLNGWAKFIGQDNVIALLNDLIEQARANGMDYVEKKFVTVGAAAGEEVDDDLPF